MRKTVACVFFASLFLICGACLKPLDIYTLTVKSDDESKGIVCGGGNYLDGATVTLTATPNEGYELLKWNDGDTSRSRIVAVSGDATYIAYFKAKTNPYAHLKLSDYQTLGNPVSSPISYDYPLYFGIRDVRQIVVTQLQGGNGLYVNVRLDMRNTTENTLNYQDEFSFWSPEYGWQNSTEMLLYDNTTIGYTAHSYQSQWWMVGSNFATVKCTYSNIGWILEFDKPVRITWIQNNVQYNLLRYSTTPL